LGLDAVAPPDVHVQHVTARLLAPGDVCVTVSHTGATSESLAATAAAAEAGATTVAITSFARSPLTELADHSIIAGSAETQYRVEAMTSRLLHIAVLDAIFVLVARGVTGRSNALDLTAQVLASHRY
jgi:DNA-binding MurR/RpiR family transcriptional regulator